ncbi:mannose-6-phosphate isomerase [Lactobacillus sp. CBA3606]|uniref:class I mannose-6-phosphate isomerase n=1 Tax=Lactobacillus sp. CBA3606 TaxID=2099789 RepID=UPI000CFD01FB|nr:class I mannose-6-phosphate isomerase [Lactobacillus sp. CBA3606]AVK64059.1 mannose-6-phosphate isomerase [Lactobacillus sp. CBA3606]
MLILKSISQPRIWGTERLKAYQATAPKTGSVYSVAGTTAIDCDTYNTKTQQSMHLHDIVTQQPTMLGLKPGEPYPIIIDMLGADEHLSIQVHPTDADARAQGLRYGKRESWYFITAPTSGKVFAGVKPAYRQGLSLTQIKQSPLAVVDQISAKAGDCLYVPAGTLHAIQKGALVYEIQQSTDVTYRFFDYHRLGLDGRPRKLAVAAAYRNLVTSNAVTTIPLPLGGTTDQRPYTLTHTRFIDTTWQNTGVIAAAITVLSGSLITASQMVLWPGQSVLALPGEIVRFKGAATVMVAESHPYWRDESCAEKV